MRGIERIFFHEGVRRWINVDTGEVYNKTKNGRKEPYLDENCEFHGGVWTKGTKKTRQYTKNGTFEYQICIDQQRYRVHRLVASFIPNPNNYPEVDHINRDPSDNRISNLRWVTREMNIANRDDVDASIAKYGVRQCEDYKAYRKVWDSTHQENLKKHQERYRERRLAKHAKKEAA